MTHQDWVAPALALTLAGAFGATAGWSRVTSPRLATRAVIVMSVLLTVSLGATLSAFALPLLGRNDLLADHAHWSDDVFRELTPTGLAVSVLSAVALGVAAIRVLQRARELASATAAAVRLREEVGATYGDTVVAALPEAEAMALASGVIVVTPTLLRALDADERRAVLAHERAHLDNRHHRYRQVAALVAAANPLLPHLPDQITYLTERWADEVAATTTSRMVTAAALVRAVGLPSRAHPASDGSMHSVATGVPDRVVALEHGLARPRWTRLVVPTLLVAVAVIVAVAAGERTLDLFQLAHALEAR